MRWWWSPESIFNYLINYLLDSPQDEQEDERNLIESINSRGHLWTKAIFRVLMRLSGVKLANRGKIKKSVNSLITGTSKDSNDFSKKPLIKNIFAPERLLLIYTSYILIKFYFIAAIRYRHDYLLHEWQPKAKSGSSFSLTSNCSIADDIHYGTQNRSRLELEPQLYWLENLSHQLGSFLYFSPGISTLIHSSLAAVTLVFYMAVFFYLNFYKLIMNSLVFILDPIEERKRVTGETEWILRSLSRKHDENEFNNMTIIHDKLLRQQVVYVKSGFDSVLCSLPGSDYHIKIVSSISKMRLIQPVFIGGRWHRFVTLLCLLTALACIVLTFSLTFVVNYAFVILDLTFQTKHRINLIECQRFNKSAISTSNHPLRPIASLTSTSDRQAYLDYDGSSTSFWYLALVVESKYYFTLRIIWTNLEYVSLLILTAIWTAFWSSVFTVEVVCNTLKLKQIERQLELSIKEAERLVDTGTFLTSNTRLFESSIIAYVYYELYRRNRGSNKQLMSFLVLQMSSLAAHMAFNYGSVYFLNSIMNGLDYVVIAAVSVVINFYLMSNAYHTKRVEAIMRKVVRLEAHSTARSMQLSYPLQLWRRQLLHDSQVQKMFATKLFTELITFEKMLFFELYLLILIILFSKLKLDMNHSDQ